MESTIAGNFAKTSQALADNAADQLQAGVHGAQEWKDAGNALSSTLTDVRDKSVPLIRKIGGRAQSAAKQSLGAISDIADQASHMAAGTADSIVRYTKKNPMKALAIAAASGALLYAVMKASRFYRD